MKKLIALILFTLAPTTFAAPATQFFLDLGVVTLTAKNPAYEWNQMQYCPGFGASCKYLTEVIIARMDLPKLQNRQTQTCTPTVRALFNDGQVGQQSVTYGRRLQVNGNKMTLVSLKNCGESLKFKVTGVAYL